MVPDQISALLTLTPKRCPEAGGIVAGQFGEEELEC